MYFDFFNQSKRPMALCHCDSSFVQVLVTSQSFCVETFTAVVVDESGVFGTEPDTVFDLRSFLCR